MLSVALSLNLASQALAAPLKVDPANSGPDVIRLMESGSCAAAPRAVAQATPGGTAPESPAASPAAPAEPAATAAASPSASASPQASTSPSPSASESTSPSAGASASPAASPSATPTAEPTPAIPPIPSGPGALFPQFPSRGGSITTPPPIPTETPAAKATGPILLERPTGTPPPIAPRNPGASPTPSPTPTPSPAPGQPSPSPIPTLGPNEYAILFDKIDASTKEGAPQDVSGNVTIFYRDGMLHGDHAHDSGDGILRLTGNTYLINQKKDAVFYADEIDFNRRTQIATLVNGRGETTEGVEQGKLYYRAQNLETTKSGVAHGDHAWFSTCENPRGGYHVEARSIDVKPNDKLIARKATLFLGAAAVLFLPILVIPLRNVKDVRRTSTFVPQLGYSQLEGLYEKSRIAFGADEYYYGVYRVDYATKRGLGLGYIATIRRKDNKRQTFIDAYTANDRIANALQNRLNIIDTENFAQNLRGQFGVNYNSDFGPNIYLPPQYTVNGSLVRTGANSSQNLTFSRNIQGSLYDSLNAAFVDTLRLGPALTQAFNVSYTSYTSTYQTTSTLHLNALTQFTTRFADYTFTVDKTDTQFPSNYDKVPELQITPHIVLGRFPVQTQVTYGTYTEQQNAFTTQRLNLFANLPVYFRVFHDSDFTASASINQDLYGTGDAKAIVTQQASLSTPFGNHFVNSITYNEQNPMGPSDVPFQTLDHLVSASHGAQDVLRIYNKDVYSLSLATSTFFNRQAQPISYQLTSRPSPRSVFIVGGFWAPGAGNGFGITNVQIWTPFGRGTDIAFTTNVDWKNKGRLENKNIIYRKTIGDCYDIRVNYNQDIQQVNVTFNLLAFPSRAGGFGLGQNTRPILPQSFAF